ncbi:MAG TPA: outer membrane protein transport protein [Candidatus Hydrogenedentes bacterium]|jgi:long-chain fatty acid transport protein|nr:outer membrane protein transport protein [Candidatus Hydrogenedentota bacterium]
MITSSSSWPARYAGYIVLAVGLFCAFASRATDGTQLTGIGAVQQGTCGTGVASPQDSTWVLLNPAGILDLGCRLDISMEVFAPDRHNQPRGLFANPLAGDMDDTSMFMIPSMGYSRACSGGESAWGIGLYGVSGMGVEYSASRAVLPRLFLKNYDRRTEYSVAQMVFAYAHALGDTGWSVGIAPRLNYSMFKSDMLTLNFAETKGGNHWDDAYGAGFSLGLYKRWERFGVGMAYTSRQWMTEFNDYDDLFFASMDLPQMMQVGVAYDLTPRLEVVADYKWIDWSGIGQIGAEPIRGGFGWRDQHVIKTGVNWYALPGWTFRAGFSHAQSPIDERHVFANALFPAVTEDSVAAGVSWNVSETSGIHVTFTHTFENTLTDNGRGDLFSVLGKGSKISLEENEITVQYSYTFAAGARANRRLEWQREEYARENAKERS